MWISVQGLSNNSKTDATTGSSLVRGSPANRRVRDYWALGKSEVSPSAGGESVVFDFPEEPGWRDAIAFCAALRIFRLGSEEAIFCRSFRAR